MQYKIERVRSLKDARLTEKFIFEAIKPGGFADSEMPIPSLKDKLAWLSYANLRRVEQPSFIVKVGEKIVGGIFGEPIETTFDIGESEITDFIVIKEYVTEEIALSLLEKIVSFYKKNGAKQIHFWLLEKQAISGEMALWKKIAIEKYGFKYNGFSRVSKWTGLPVRKIELNVKNVFWK
jgi:hypothetical protein